MEIGADSANKRIKLIDGENFSGRSSFLRSIVKAKNSSQEDRSFGVMVGEIPANYITGLAPTVGNEIALHGANQNKQYLDRIKDLLSDLSFEKHLNKNPFNLSGGEQAVLTTVCALLLEPKQLAIDTTLEQLNKEWRTPLLDAFFHSTFEQTEISIADNRFDEYSIAVQRVLPDVFNQGQNPSELTGERICCPTQLKSSAVPQKLSLNNLSFGYSKKEILLQNLNYEFEPGHIYHMNGANGVGKSTLSKILTGVLKPSSGKIFSGNFVYDAYRYPGKMVGYSFQNPDEQIFSSTVKEEVLPIQLQKRQSNADFSEAIFSAFSLDKHIEKHPSEMPFVIRKRIALAATLANERDWYILDEPTIGQDNSNVKEIAKLIKKLAACGKGIILISHSEKFVSHFENVTSITLNNGKIKI